MSQIEARIHEGLMRIENRLSTIEEDIRSFPSKTGNLEGRTEAIEKHGQRK